MSILDAAGNVYRWAAGAAVPMFARPVAPVGPAWVVHAGLVAGLAAGLFHVQRWAGLTPYVSGGRYWFPPDYWLPALFLLGYLLSWSAVWLWRTLAPGRPAADFPDLDEAWGEVLAALDRAGVGTADTPLFLVLGGPAGGDPLFGARPPGLVVAGGTGPASPLRVYASRDAIYLAVPGAGLLGARGVEPAAGDGDGGGDTTDWGGRTIGPDHEEQGALGEIQAVRRRAHEEGRPLTEDERRRVRELSAGAGPRATGPGPQDAEVSKRAADRLAHVCGRIAATRWPLCPLNGAVLAVPVGAADRDESARQWGLFARQDLAVAEAALKLRFPVYALVGGAGDLPGGDLFFERFAPGRDHCRLGKCFPLNPDLRPADAAGAVEAAAGWVFGELLPHWALRLARVDGADDARPNGQLVRFLAEAGRRGPHLARLVGRAVTPGDRVPLFGGCYLTVAPPAGRGGAVFADGFFRRVEGTQGYVAWTDEARAADAAYRSATRLGYAALAAVLTLVVLFGWYVALASPAR